MPSGIGEKETWRDNGVGRRPGKPRKLSPGEIANPKTPEAAKQAQRERKTREHTGEFNIRDYTDPGILDDGDTFELAAKINTTGGSVEADFRTPGAPSFKAKSPLGKLHQELAKWLPGKPRDDLADVALGVADDPSRGLYLGA